MCVRVCVCLHEGCYSSQVLAALRRDVDHAVALDELDVVAGEQVLDLRAAAAKTPQPRS